MLLGKFKKKRNVNEINNSDIAAIRCTRLLDLSNLFQHYSLIFHDKYFRLLVKWKCEIFKKILWFYVILRVKAQVSEFTGRASAMKVVYVSERVVTCPISLNYLNYNRSLSDFTHSLSRAHLFVIVTYHLEVWRPMQKQKRIK